MNINKLIEGQREEIKKILFEADMSEGETKLTEKLVLKELNNALIKFLDSEIERLEKETAKDRKKKLGLPTEMNGFIQMGTIAGKAKAITDQITHLQDIKKQLE